ncbi:hypothetical protein NC652_006770 [Populus alba x Populus x berolinensis]|nr:hypothetical protein NC652_006770 [Populus alba x Populus x berolinensis]
MDGSTFDARSGTGMKPLPAASGDAGRVVVELDPNIIEKTGFEGVSHPSIREWAPRSCR